MYRFFSILSLDVVLGACICSLFVAEFLNVSLSAEMVIILGVTVWLIYTFDHLMDAKNTAHQASTRRHRFHQQYFIPLTLLCILMLAIAAWLIFELPVKTVMWGVVLSCTVLAYFLLLYLLKLKSAYHKEIMIALLYAAGIMLGPVSIYQGPVNIRIFVLFAQFSMLAFSNLVIFALYELHIDERDNFPSIIRIIGPERMNRALKILLGLQLALAIFMSRQIGFSMLEYTLAGMIFIFILLTLYKPAFAKDERYRYVGDAVFLLPVITVMIGVH